MESILLIQPPSKMQKLQKIKSRKPEIWVPLSLITLSPYLLKERFDVEIIDLRIDTFATLRKYLKKRKPRLAGISIMPGHALPIAIGVSEFIKKSSPETKIIWGGSFPSLHYRLCLNASAVDFVVCGDGEVTLAELALVIKDSDNLDNLLNIKGLAFRYAGDIIKTQAREPVDLDAEPIGAWTLIDKYMDTYLGDHKSIIINTARGCPFKCTFCYNNVLYKGFQRYRTKSIECVMEEIKYLIERYGIKKILFMDDDFLGNRKRGLEIVSLLKKEFTNIKYHINARSDELKHERIFRHLADTGLDSVFIGAETGSEKQLFKIEKGCETNDIIETAKLCDKYNVAGKYSFTCGYPNESNDDLFATIRMATLIKNIDKRGDCFIEIISLICGTPLYNELEKNNLLPETSLSKWCYLTDWKSAKYKLWINKWSFYEAFQLAFFLAFSNSTGGDGGLHFHTKFLSNWSQHRLIKKKPTLLPEYRLANLIVKKLLW